MMGSDSREMHYKTIFDSIGLGIIYQSAGGEILDMNPAAEKMLHITKERLTEMILLGQNLNMVHDDLTPYSIDEHPTMKSIRIGKPVYNEVVGFWFEDDGSYRWLSVSAIPEFREGETIPYRVFATFTDITEQKQVEEALNSSEQNYRNTMDDSPLGIRIISEEGETLYANQAMLNIYGYATIEELKQIPVKERYTAESYLSHEERKKKRRGKEYVAPHYTVSIIRKDGDIRYLEVFRKQVIWNGQNQYQVICNDITQRKRDEEDLLLRSRLLDEAHDGICLYNPAGEFVYVNSGFCRMHNCSREDVIGANIRDFSEAATDEFLDWLTVQLQESGTKVFESTHTLPDGSPLYLEVHSTEIELNGIVYNLSIERDIGERKRMEAALHESEINFRNTIDKSPLGVLIKKDIDTINYANQAALDLFGYTTMEDFSNITIDRRQLDEVSDRFFERWRRFEAGEMINTTDNYPIIRSDGDIRFVEVNISPVVWNGTNHLQFIFKDSTEEHLINIERLALNGASRSVLTSTDFLSAARQIFDYCREVTGATSGYIALLNEETGENDVLFLEAGGLPCTVDPSLPMPVRGLREEAYRTGKSVYENRFPETNWHTLLPEGHVLLQNVLFSPLVVDDKVVGVIGLANKQADFTDNDVRIINSLAEICSIALVNSRYLELISANEEKYRLLFESISDGFAIHEMIFDEKGNGIGYRFLEMNPAFEAQTGFTRDSVLGKCVTDVLPGSENDPADWIGRYGEVVKTGIPIEFEQYSESLNKWFSVLAFRNTPGQFATITRDITENKKIEQERERTAKLESVGTLAGGIAHDFNNIMTGILGNVSLAKMNLDPESELFQVLDEAEKASFRARDLTHQLLTFARGGEPIRKVTKIDTLIREAATFGTRGSRTKPVFSVQRNLWAIDADEGQINQVIMNIVNNAVEAMPGGGDLRISAENREFTSSPGGVAEPGDYVEICIRDSGIGIAPEFVERIFEPYFTTKQRGSGLGLATTYSIIRNHNGHIRCESAPGQGTAFYIYLPAVRDELEEENESSEAPLTGEGLILVMDDEDLIRMLVKRILTNSGYTVQEAKDGKEAVRKYTEAMQSGEPFSAVILDLTVPGGLGGEATLAKLKEIDPQVKAIVSSGYSTNAVMADFASHGFKGMVAKPYNPKQLRTTLAEVLGEK